MHSLGDHVRDAGDDRVAELLLDVLDGEAPARADDARQQPARLGHLNDVGAERAQPYHAELRVAHRDRLRRAPLEVGILLQADIVDIGAEGALVAERQLDEIDQQRNVGGRERVAARNEHIEEATVAREEGQLALAHDALRAEPQLARAIGRDASDNDVAGGVEIFDQVEQGHELFLLR